MTDEQLELIEQYAFDLMSWNEIAILMKIPVLEFKVLFDNRESSLFLAYQRGKVRRKHELRVPILQMATAGSPQAEILAVKFLKEQFLDEYNDY